MAERRRLLARVSARTATTSSRASTTGRAKSAIQTNRCEPWRRFEAHINRRSAQWPTHVPILYGSRPPAEDSVWNRIRDDGFDVKVFDRNIRNKEKGVDMEMGMDVAQLLYTIPASKTIIIAAGDADYLPAIERAKGKGWQVEVWFWSNAAVELQKAASRFVALDPHLEFLRLGGGAVS